MLFGIPLIERDDLLAFLKALEVKADGFERPKLP